MFACVVPFCTRPSAQGSRHLHSRGNQCQVLFVTTRAIVLSRLRCEFRFDIGLEDEIQCLHMRLRFAHLFLRVSQKLSLAQFVQESRTKLHRLRNNYDMGIGNSLASPTTTAPRRGEIWCLKGLTSISAGSGDDLVAPYPIWALGGNHWVLLRGANKNT